MSDEGAWQMPLGLEETDPPPLPKHIWRPRALACVIFLCKTRPEFLCDDVWAAGLPHCEGGDKGLGAVMLKAAGLGYCYQTDRGLPSKRSRKGPKLVWHSLHYAPKDGVA